MRLHELRVTIYKPKFTRNLFMFLIKARRLADILKAKLNVQLYSE